MDDLIDKRAVAKLIGSKDSNMPLRKLYNDPTFPRSVNHSTGKAGRPQRLWRRSDVLDWIKFDKNRPRDLAGRLLSTRQLQAKVDFLPMDAFMASAFIRGLFATARQNSDRYRRIQKARRTGAKVLQRVRTEGDCG